MNARTHLRLAILFALASVAFAAEATPAAITFHFTGVVEFVQGELSDELLAPGFTAADLIGTSFHGSYTFDSTASDANSHPALGQYHSVGSPYGMEFHFIHRSFFFDEVHIGVIQDFDIVQVTPGLLDDIYAAQSEEDPHPTDPLLSYRGRLDLIESGTGLVGPDTALIGDGLPVTPPDIQTFDDFQRVFVNVLRLEDDNGQLVSRVRAGIGGTLQALQLPEPTVTALLAFGIAASVVGRRHRR